MSRLEGSPSLESQWLRRNLSLDVLSAVGVGVMLAMVVSLLPSAARQAGMAPIVLALLAAVPYIANLLSAFGSRLGAHSTLQLGLMRVAGAAMVLLVAFLPSAPVVVMAVFVFWLSLALGGPFHVRVWGQTTRRTLAAGSWACSAVPGPPRWPRPRSWAACSPTRSAASPRSP